MLAASRNHPRLDLDQRAGHIEKIAHRVHVELLEHRQVAQELIGNRRDRQIDDLHLMLPHQVQEQIERPTEDFQIDAKVHAALGSVSGPVQQAGRHAQFYQSCLRPATPTLTAATLL
jgi:hypothetical protein